MKKTETELTETKITRLFKRACAEHLLLEDGDRVLVAVSGGKDSLELVRLFSRQMRIHKPRIEAEAAHVIMDNIPYETEREYLESFCNDNGIKLNIIHSSFDDSSADITNAQQRKRKTKCFLCSWYRRKALFEYATSNRFNKIALGHHQDDFLVTFLMNLTFEGNAQTMRPSMKMRHYPITVIRPLCLVPEHLISSLAHLLKFEKQKTPCPYEEKSMRDDMTQIFRQIETLNPEARYSMWNAICNNTTNSDIAQESP